ncbi:MAG: DNA mismatch repair protein MutS [Firmicutes bacterium]|nr:DNA mismatch repair protein MutS [Bacillota bacterium]
MNVHLLYPDRDPDLEAELPFGAEALAEDLGLEAVFDAMAQGDAWLRKVARAAVLTSVSLDAPTIRYRQEALQDCLSHPAEINELYACAGEAQTGVRELGILRFYARSPNAVLYSAVRVLAVLLRTLKHLRSLVDAHGDRFRSPAFRQLFETIRRELDEDFFCAAERHAKTLEFSGGMLLSAGLGAGNKASGYVLRAPSQPTRGWLRRLVSRGSDGFSFTVAPRDEAGHEALAAIKDRGVNLVADALARSNDHVLAFLQALRTQLAFYIAGANLRARLDALNVPTSMPTPEEAQAEGPVVQAVGLRDVALALQVGTGAVGNDLAAAGQRIVVVTGANRGGKSTFLRSLGQAQVLMQAGLFVTADRFASTTCRGVFTHFKREEDPAMLGGKLDEELRRMRDIVDHAGPGSLLLMNESFASTNERDGSEIARQIVLALADAGVRVGYVTHLYEFARSLYEEGRGDTLFLRAERLADGRRTFRVVEGEPLGTSFGDDVYRRVFDLDDREAQAADPS